MWALLDLFVIAVAWFALDRYITWQSRQLHERARRRVFTGRHLPHDAPDRT